jgi:undecaprenyl-diphosphatase
VTLTTPVAAPSLKHELRTVATRLLFPFLLVGVVTVLLGLFLTKVLDNSGVAEADVATNRWLADHRSGTGVTLSKYGTLLGETPTIVGLTVIAAVVLRLVYKRWREPLLLVVCVSAQAIIFLVTTLLIDRNRPQVSRLDDSPPTSSFPSGHTAATTAFYLGLALLVAWHTRRTWLRWLIIAAGALFPLIMASCRMYRGMHYPTDIVVSIGLALSLLTIALKLMPLSEGGGPRREP